MIDNWRWQGVPFYLRSGKRMARRVTEIAIQFRRRPTCMFPRQDGKTIDAQRARDPHAAGRGDLAHLRDQGARRRRPDDGGRDGFQLRRGVRRAGPRSPYETLLLDCMLGDATLFTRSDEVEAAWEVVDPVIEAWDDKDPEHFPNYAAGSWGPAIADEFIARDGARWRQP